MKVELVMTSKSFQQVKNNKIDVESSDFKADLNDIMARRSKKPPRPKLLHTKAQNFLLGARDEASIQSYSITISYPYEKTRESAWSSILDKLNKIVRKLGEFPVYCGLLSIEIHKKRNDAHNVPDVSMEERHPRLAGKPHFHICLMLYNDFLCPSKAVLQEALTFYNSKLDDIQINQLRPENPMKGKGFNAESKNQFLYCTKDLIDVEYQKFLKKMQTEFGSVKKDE